MPAKAKATSKAKEPEGKSKEPEPQQAPKTANERSLQRFYLTNPLEKRREEVGLHGLTPGEKQTWVNSLFINRVSNKKVNLSNKADREFWKQVNKESLPIRHLRKDYDWGTDKHGRDVGDYPLEQFEQRIHKQNALTALEILHKRFLAHREYAETGTLDLEGKLYEITPEAIEEEKTRRKEMAALKSELYGEKTGPYAQDPEWDDVVPIPAVEPEGALAAIAYPDDYAEVMSYLRAVMVNEEYSPRCLRLTEHVISMNPAHYTVWLYRFKIISSMDIPIPEEIVWLNQVSLDHLKNYQIWHHRQLLIDHYHPQIKSDEVEVKKLARSETEFLTVMLDEDTKNYHVWSYRQYLVRKLGTWTLPELLSTQNLIEDDVRNNSAWSHRFFLIFSNPNASTADSHSTEYDPKIPTETIDREIKYTQGKALLAPQNQASWNYLRGVLVKGGRKLQSQEEFAAQFVTGLGEGEGKEDVRSSHALEFLVDVHVEKGEKAEAEKCLERLAEKWDPVRAGYWNYRKQQIAA